jgi:hypothetical protein
MSRKLSKLELQHAHRCLLDLKEAIVDERSEEAADPNEHASDALEQQVDTAISLIESELEAQV